MIIDCAGCVMRDLACDDCVVTFLLGPADELGPAERTALAVLADGGLVPPLRMQPPSPAGATDTGERTRRSREGIRGRHEASA